MFNVDEAMQLGLLTFTYAAVQYVSMQCHLTIGAVLKKSVFARWLRVPTGQFGLVNNHWAINDSVINITQSKSMIYL